MATLCLIIWRTAWLFSEVAVPLYISSSSGISQSQNIQNTVWFHLVVSSVVKFIKTKSTMMVAREEFRVSVWKDEKVIAMEGGDACTTMWMYLMSQNCTLKND